jgi:hypothetical protein
MFNLALDSKLWDCDVVAARHGRYRRCVSIERPGRGFGHFDERERARPKLDGVEVASVAKFRG